MKNILLTSNFLITLIKAIKTSKIVTHGQTRQGTTRGGCDPWEVTSEHSPPYERLPPAVYETACMRLQVVKVLTEPIETHVIPST